MPHTLRISRTDNAADAFVLVNVQPAGPLPLDLRLVATDGLCPFVGQIKESGIGKLQAKEGDRQEWSAVLSAVLLHQADRQTSNVELVATVDHRITITVRRNVGGITVGSSPTPCSILSNIAWYSNVLAPLYYNRRTKKLSNCLNGLEKRPKALTSCVRSSETSRHHSKIKKVR